MSWPICEVGEANKFYGLTPQQSGYLKPSRAIINDQDVVAAPQHLPEPSRIIGTASISSFRTVHRCLRYLCVCLQHLCCRHRHLAFDLTSRTFSFGISATCSEGFFFNDVYFVTLGTRVRFHAEISANARFMSIKQF